MKEIKVRNCKWIILPNIDSKEKGILNFAEETRHIPFKIKRIYYTYRIKDLSTVRGKHSHKKLEQVIFCLNGYFDMLLDDGNNRQVIKLNTPNKGLYIGNDLWREMKNFSPDCVLLVLASEFYDENDYIRDYGEFCSHKEV